MVKDKCELKLQVKKMMNIHWVTLSTIFLSLPVKFISGSYTYSRHSVAFQLPFGFSEPGIPVSPTESAWVKASKTYDPMLLPDLNFYLRFLEQLGLQDRSEDQKNKLLSLRTLLNNNNPITDGFGIHQMNPNFTGNISPYNAMGFSENSCPYLNAPFFTATINQFFQTMYTSDNSPEKKNSKDADKVSDPTSADGTNGGINDDPCYKRFLKIMTTPIQIYEEEIEYSIVDDVPIDPKAQRFLHSIFQDTTYDSLERYRTYLFALYNENSATGVRKFDVKSTLLQANRKYLKLRELCDAKQLQNLLSLIKFSDPIVNIQDKNENAEVVCEYTSQGQIKLTPPLEFGNYFRVLNVYDELHKHTSSIHYMTFNQSVYICQSQRNTLTKPYFYVVTTWPMYTYSKPSEINVCIKATTIQYAQTYDMNGELTVLPDLDRIDFLARGEIPVKVNTNGSLNPTMKQLMQIRYPLPNRKLSRKPNRNT